MDRHLNYFVADNRQSVKQFLFERNFILTGKLRTGKFHFIQRIFGVYFF